VPLRLAVCFSVLSALSAGPLGAQVEAISLLGDSLRRPALAPEAEARLLAQLDSARRAYEADSTSADALIWLGRRTAYLGRYRDAIAIYTDGIRKHANDPRLYRHRGHRYITLRRLNDAVADFRRAAELIHGKPDEVEPDGQPNAQNIPTSTLQSNIWYHYGLALYLQGDFAKALEAYLECMKVSKNPDMLVATSHWLYMTLRRLGQEAEAAEVLEPITRDVEVIENGEYHRLLLMYKGEIPSDSLLGTEEATIGGVTAAYGVGNWHLYNGRPAEAEAVFRRIVATGTWAAFGYIGAEAELARR
jgi:tetratricopeptide (TPR) repeat protein